jgi:hypothetical protein
MDPSCSTPQPGQIPRPFGLRAEKNGIKELNFLEGFSQCRGNTSIGNAMKRCPETKKETNMKTKVLLVGTIITAFAFASFAAEPLLTPRAKGNQIKVVSSAAETGPAITINYVATTSALFSPRAAGNQIKSVKGTYADVNPALVCRENMNGTPRAVAECSSHATMPACTTVASY